MVGLLLARGSAPPLLRQRPSALRIQPRGLRRAAGLRRLALFGHDQRAGDQRSEPLGRSFAITQLTARVAGDQPQPSLGIEPRRQPLEQPLALLGREAR